MTDPMTGTQTQGDYVGVYVAEVGRTTVNVEVDKDEFTAVSFTRAEASADATLRPASAGRSNVIETWVALTGDITQVESTVTATITEVRRDDVTLQGAELEAYTNCSITVTAGDRFDADLMDAVSRCLDLGTLPVTLHQGPRPALWGRWETVLSGAEFGGCCTLAAFELSSGAGRHELFHYARGTEPRNSPSQWWTFDVENVTDTTFDIVITGADDRTEADGYGMLGSRETLYYAFSSGDELIFTYYEIVIPMSRAE